MRESVIYQEILQEGLQRGRQEGELAIIVRLLARKLGEINPETRSRLQKLTIPQLEELGEALLDFTQAGDLIAWLESKEI